MLTHQLTCANLRLMVTKNISFKTISSNGLVHMFFVNGFNPQDEIFQVRWASTIHRGPDLWDCAFAKTLHPVDPTKYPPYPFNWPPSGRQPCETSLRESWSLTLWHWQTRAAICPSASTFVRQICCPIVLQFDDQPTTKRHISGTWI